VASTPPNQITYATAPPEFKRYNWHVVVDVTTPRNVAEVESNTTMFPPPVIVQPVLVVMVYWYAEARFTMWNSNEVPTASSVKAAITSAAVGNVKVVSATGVPTNNLLSSSCAAVGVGAAVTATAVTFSRAATYVSKRLRVMAPCVSFANSGIIFLLDF